MSESEFAVEVKNEITEKYPGLKNFQITFEGISTCIGKYRGNYIVQYEFTLDTAMQDNVLHVGWQRKIE